MASSDRDLCERSESPETQVEGSRAQGHRILLIDDSPDIHEDIRKVLNGSGAGTSLSELEAELFSLERPPPALPAFDIESAMQGREGFELARTAAGEGNPFSLAFVDMRMPPGWDGLETVSHIWDVDPDIEIVICTAYSDHTWEEILTTLKRPDQLLILKKPFDMMEVRQLARALTVKWTLRQEVRDRLNDLEALVAERTLDLERVNAALTQEMEDRAQMEVELRHAQKLEAVGRLAAGIAHEINTPIQYVGDSLFYLRETFQDLERLLALYRETLQGMSQERGLDGLPAPIAEAERRAGIDCPQGDVPEAFDDTEDGIRRVAGIVSAMKEFAHPGRTDMSALDINRAVHNALTVARNEYKHLARVVMELGDLPTVTCYAGDVNQALLNVIVNAAHAIADAVGDSGELGVITVCTSADDGKVQIRVSDTGPGIPETIQHQVFDPFFTTKEVGRGTGQGLAIARSCIVDKHGGALTFESEPGRGATFSITLPCEPAQAKAS